LASLSLKVSSTRSCPSCCDQFVFNIDRQSSRARLLCDSAIFNRPGSSLTKLVPSRVMVLVHSQPGLAHRNFDGACRYLHAQANLRALPQCYLSRVSVQSEINAQYIGSCPALMYPLRSPMYSLRLPKLSLCIALYKILVYLSDFWTPRSTNCG